MEKHLAEMEAVASSSMMMKPPTADESRIPPATVVRNGFGFVASEAPSIASIRSEVETLRRRKQEEEAARRLAEEVKMSKSAASQGASVAAATEAFTGTLINNVKPSYSLQDASLQQALAAHDFIARRRCQRDVDDVLRKKKASDSLRLAMMSTRISLCVGGDKDRTACMASFQSLLKEKIHSLMSASDDHNKPAATASPVLVEPGDPVHQLATFMIIEEATPDVLRRWIKFGVVDPLWWLSSEELTAAGGGDAAVSASSGPAGGDELHDERLPSTHESLHRTCEMVATAATQLKHMDLPPADVAPVILKAEQGQFESVMEKELKALEAYEKSDAKLHGQAWSCSSPLLKELAKDDPKLRASLDVLERVKRATLFDKKFQEALDYVHALEKARYDSVEKIAPKPRTQAAEVPYFFGSRLSQPPPSADMNLSPPKPSKLEQGKARRRQKIMRLKRRFGL